MTLFIGERRLIADGEGYLHERVSCFFHGEMYGHSIEHRAYCIPSPNNPKIMIPEQSVAVIGLWDEEKKEFKQ